MSARSKGDDKKPCLVTFCCKLYKQISNSQGEPYHGHEVHYRIIDLVPFNGGKKSQINHMGKNAQDKKGLFVFFGKLYIAEKMNAIKRCRYNVKQ